MIPIVSRIPAAFLSLAFSAALVSAEDVPWIKGARKIADTAPVWSEAKTIKIEEAELLGSWYGMTVEKDYYSVWQIEYKKGGEYEMTNYDRMFFDELGEHEDSRTVTKGTWSIREDGVIVFDEAEENAEGDQDDEMEDGDELEDVGELWVKLIEKEGDKYAYLTVSPDEEDALATVIYEFKGTVPAVLLNLPPTLSSPFKK